MKPFLRFSVYGSLGSLVILSLLQPFGINELGPRRIPFILGETACVFVCLFFTDVISDYFLSKNMDNTHKRSSSIWRIAWHLAPLFIFKSLVIAAALLTFNGWFHWDDMFNGWVGADGFTLRPYFSMAGQVLVISFLLYIWAIYRESNEGLRDEVSELRALNSLLEERQEAVATMEEEQPTQPEVTCTCRIEGKYHNNTLEIDPRSIVYVESMSNYADICYMQDDNMVHKTLRITLKQLRESLADVDCLMSCHRAFIVNLNFVVSISPRVSGGYQLDIFGCDKQIPVSRTYVDEIKQRMRNEIQR